MPVTFEVEQTGLEAFNPGTWSRLQARAYRKAGITAARDMKSEAKKRILNRLRLKASLVAKALSTRVPKGFRTADMTIALDISGEAITLFAYTHSVTRRGVSVRMNKARGRTLHEGAFLARMPSGHRGIFKRVGPGRLPIKELRGSKPVDVLLRHGEAEMVGERGVTTLLARFPALLQIELDKAG